VGQKVSSSTWGKSKQNLKVRGSKFERPARARSASRRGFKKAKRTISVLGRPHNQKVAARKERRKKFD